MIWTRQTGQFQEFSVPAELIADSSLRLTWDPIDESQLPWSQRLDVAEVGILTR